MATAALKELHDRLLAERPEGDPHDKANCAVCAMHSDNEGAAGGHPGGDMTTFTQEQLDEAIASATAPLAARVAELEGMSKVAEIDAAINDARKPLEEELTTTKASLDAKVVEAQTERDRAEGILAWLEGEATSATEAAARAEKQAARVAEAKEAFAFEDEYVAANSERWADISDEEWAATLESWRTIAAKVPATAGADTGSPPAATGLAAGAGRETASARPGMSAIREVMALRSEGVDPRTLSSLNR